MPSYAAYPSLKDRAVLISGGGTGIGAVMVEHFAEQGARVAFFDIQDAPAEALAARIAAAGHSKPHYRRCDVRDIPDLRLAVAEAAKAVGPIRVLVNNASRDDRHDFATVEPDYFDDMLAVNMRHHVFAAQAVAPMMKAAGGGSIINFGSCSWIRRRTGMVGYTTAKAAINGLTRTLARELGPDNIRVNSLLPGAILTERQAKLWRTPEEDRMFLEVQALKQLLEPPEVARMALFLAADDSSACTGHNFFVDGGLA
jgi:NAD(P)-dependent dehydrogenase (short-subunit alcohol dehydrogenase family)